MSSYNLIIKKIIFVLCAGLFAFNNIPGQDNVKVLSSIPHQGALTWVAVSPDNRLVATTGNDGTISIWDIFTLREIRSIKAHSSKFMMVLFSSDKEHLFSSGNDGEICEWDIKTGTKIKSMSLGYSQHVNGISLDPTETWIAACGKSVTFWNIASGKLEKTIEPLSIGDFSITAWSPDGKYVVALKYNEILVIDGITKTDLKRITGFNRSLAALSFSPDSKYLAISGRDDQSYIEILKTKNWKTAKGITAKQYPTALCFSPDGKILLAGFSEGIISYNTDNWSEVSSFGFGFSNTTYSIAFTKDSKLFLSGHKDSSALKLWNTEPASLEYEVKEINGGISNVTFGFLPYLSYISHNRHDIGLFDPFNNKLKIYAEKDKEFTCLAPLLNSRNFLFAGFNNGSIAMFSEPDLTKKIDFVGLTKGISTITAGPNNNIILISGLNNVVGFFAVDTNLSGIIGRYSAEAFCIAISRREDKYAYCLLDKEKNIVVYDVKTSKEIWKKSCGEHFGGSCAFNFSGDTLFTLDEDYLKKWDAKNGDLLEKIPLPFKNLSSKINFSCKYFISADKSQNKIYKLSTSNANILASVDYPENTHFLNMDIYMTDDFVAFSSDINIYIHDAKNLKLLATIVPFDGQEYFIYTPDGRFNGTKKGLTYLSFVKDDRYFDYNSAKTRFKIKPTPHLLGEILIRTDLFK